MTSPGLLFALGLFSCVSQKDDQLEGICDAFKTKLAQASELQEQLRAEAEPLRESGWHQLYAAFSGPWPQLGYDVCFPESAGDSEKKVALDDAMLETTALLLQLRAAWKTGAPPGDRHQQLQDEINIVLGVFDIAPAVAR